MKKIKKSENLRRASEVITCDRMGVSSGIEGILNKELYNLLSNYFSLLGEIKSKIVATSEGFEINIKANASSVKQFKMV